MAAVGLSPMKLRRVLRAAGKDEARFVCGAAGNEGGVTLRE